ncbi:MAG: hypothetical protein Q9218_007395 [Villophora microphyllina]
MGGSATPALGSPSPYEEAWVDGRVVEPGSSPAPPKQSFPETSPQSRIGGATNSQDVPNRNVSIEATSHTTLPYLRRIISLLLPIRYPDKFFAESVSNPGPSSLARVAVWHDRDRQEDAWKTRTIKSPAITEPSSSHHKQRESQNVDLPGTVVGGIQCRIEYRLCDQSSAFDPAAVSQLKPRPAPQVQETKYCYIQTLALLSPYRSKGIATLLLENILATLCREDLYYGTKIIYAHVWEMNEEALEWYKKRGFKVCEDVVRDYYQRLKPAGARLVWKELGVSDHLRAKGEGDFGSSNYHDGHDL